MALCMNLAGTVRSGRHGTHFIEVHKAQAMLRWPTIQYHALLCHKEHENKKSELQSAQCLHVEQARCRLKGRIVVGSQSPRVATKRSASRCGRAQILESSLVRVMSAGCHDSRSQ